MSRIGKNTIPVPDKTTVAITEGVISVKGPLGELTKKIHSQVDIAVEEDGVKVAPKNTSKLSRSLHGTFASHIINMIKGVNTKYEKQLEVHGVGYKVDLSGQTLKLQVGFSHPIEIPIPEGLEVKVEKNLITVGGIDKEKVGQFAANIRATKKPEPYKGKGVRYAGEYVRQKQGKKAV